MADSQTDRDVRLNEQLQILGEFSAYLVHEVSNPLSIIKGKVLTIESQMKELNINHEKLLQDVRRIDETTDRIVEIIRSVRLLAHRDSLLDLQRVNIEECIQLARTIMEAKLAIYRIHFQIHLESTEWPLARKTELVHVLVNLYENSIKALMQELESSIVTRVYEQGDFVIMDIHDSAQSLKEDVQEFFRTFYSGKVRSQHGLGLGLYLCSQTLNKLGGGLEHFDSEGIQGFRIRLKKGRV